MDSIKIIHLSDLHRREKSLIKIERLKKKYPEHFFVITGDITENGNLEEYDIMQNYISEDMFLCPGNHDVATKGNFDWKYKEKLALFDVVCNTAFSFSRKPKIDIIENVALIGLNSNPGSWGWLFDFAKGTIGIKQRYYLKSELNRLKSYTRIVYLHHHPFMHSVVMKINDSKKLMDILKNNCEILLFGHKHKQKMFKDNKYNIPVIHCAGALYNENEVLEISIKNKKITTSLVS